MSDVTNEVLVERIDNFKETIKSLFDGIHRRFDENAIEHKKLDENQKYTNGNVKRLQMWKAGLATGLSVTIFIISYALKDYFEFKNSYYETEKNNIILIEKLNQQNDEIKKIQKKQESLSSYLNKFNIVVEE